MNNDKPSSESSHSPTEQPGDAKHTRGPWMYDKNPMMIYAMYGKEYIPIAVVSDEEIGDLNEVQANAELIASAPDLLSEVSTLRSKQAELVAENERLREVLEGVLRLEDLIRYPDTVLPAQHQGEAEAINLMLDKIKAALTTTPKTMNEDEYPKWLTEADIVWLKKAEKDYQSDITMIPIEPKDDHANGLIQGILYERERQASELDKLRTLNQSLTDERNGLGYDLLHVTAERDELNTAIAHVWKALGVTDYTGKHISEHVSDLRAQIEAADKLIDWHEGNHKASKP